MKHPNRIYIIGTSGSGKTYFAKKLSQKLGIPFYDSDDVGFIEKFSKSRPVQDRKKLIDKISKKKKWIIDARVTSWAREPMKKADLIIWLRTSPFIRTLRILKRYLARKMNGKRGYSESMKEIIKLIRFSLSYEKSKSGSGLNETFKFLKNNKLEPIIIRNSKQKNKLLKQLK